MTKLIINNDPKSPISEAYRSIRTNIQFSDVDSNIKTIVVTSSIASEGKSTIISNIAVAMAQAGKKVLLIDMDLRRSRIHKIFNIENTQGITNLFVDYVFYKDIIRTTDIDNLSIITSGPIPPNPSELISSNKMKDFIDIMKESFDYILFDAPPVNLVTDAALLAAICDGTILVVAAGDTHIKSAQHSKDNLEKVGANILGVILNKVPIDKNSYYKYHYYNYQFDEYSTKKGFFSKRKKKIK